VDELQSRLDDARHEVVRAMAKLQSLATRAESSLGHGRGRDRAAGRCVPQTEQLAAVAEYEQGSQLLHLATAEFDQQNYAGALYLATEAKNAAAAGRGRVASDDRSATRRGEVPFALPLRLQTTGRRQCARRAGGRLQSAVHAGDRRAGRRLLVRGSVGAHQGRRRSVRLDSSDADRPATVSLATTSQAPWDAPPRRRDHRRRVLPGTARHPPRRSAGRVRRRRRNRSRRDQLSRGTRVCDASRQRSPRRCRAVPGKTRPGGDRVVARRRVPRCCEVSRELYCRGRSASDESNAGPIASSLMRTH